MPFVIHTLLLGLYYDVIKEKWNKNFLNMY